MIHFDEQIFQMGWNHQPARWWNFKYFSHFDPDLWGFHDLQFGTTKSAYFFFKWSPVGLGSQARLGQHPIAVPRSKLVEWWALGGSLTRWWFHIFFLFTPIWGRFPIWLVFVRWVETTNRLIHQHFSWDLTNGPRFVSYDRAMRYSGYPGFWGVRWVGAVGDFLELNYPFGGIKQCRCMVIWRDFRHNSALFGLLVVDGLLQKSGGNSREPKNEMSDGLPGMVDMFQVD